jgi:splicing factor 3A subunit 3
LEQEEINEVDLFDDNDQDEEPIRMTIKDYPIGWDGKPIPYWLYKLHGLGIEYKCEICGNTSYFGRKAFERHFQVSPYPFFVFLFCVNLL